MSRFAAWLWVFGVAITLPLSVLPQTITGTYSFQVTAGGAGGCLPGSLCPPGNFMLDFDDEFNGTSIDQTKWKVYPDGTLLAGGAWTVQDSAITVSGGTVKMTVTEPGHYAILDTKNAYPGPGYWEARIMYVDAHSGYWHSAGWGNTLAEGYEIDDPESFGGCGGVYHLIYAPGGNLTFVPPDPGFNPQTNLCNGFHIFGYEIDQATGGTFFLDGVPFGNIPEAYSTASFFTQLFYNSTTFPPMEVDWVRHYIKLP
jgi:hypothetical protein